MCVKEFLAFACGHCALPTLLPCPLATQSPHFPYCRYPAERALPLPENCPPCARVVWNQQTLAEEREHREMHIQAGREGCTVHADGMVCEVKFDIDLEREERGKERERGQGLRGMDEGHGWGMERKRESHGRQRAQRLNEKRKKREIEEKIAIVEARFAAMSAKVGENSTAEANEECVQEYQQREDSSRTYSTDSVVGGRDEISNDAEKQERGSDRDEDCSDQVSDHLTPGTSADAGSSISHPVEASSNHHQDHRPAMEYVGYMLDEKVVIDGQLPTHEQHVSKAKEQNDDDDSGHHFHAASETSPDFPDSFVQRYVGPVKYYPGEEQYERATWDEMIVNAKHNKQLPKGPRALQTPASPFGNMTPPGRTTSHSLPFRPHVPSRTTCLGATSTPANAGTPATSPHGYATTARFPHQGRRAPASPVQVGKTPDSAGLSPRDSHNHQSPQSGHSAPHSQVPTSAPSRPIVPGQPTTPHHSPRYQGPPIVSSDMAYQTPN